MKGLTPQQLIDITAFIQKHHKFGLVRDEDQYNGKMGYCIKYIDACYDSREGDYWSVAFRGMGRICFHTNAFLIDELPFTNLYDWVMAFLKYEWEPHGKKFDFMHGEKEGPLHNSFPNGILETEWSDFDMIEAYCADLEDRDANDMLDATKWIMAYRYKKQNITK